MVKGLEIEDHNATVPRHQVQRHKRVAFNPQCPFGPQCLMGHIHCTCTPTTRLNTHKSESEMNGSWATLEDLGWPLAGQHGLDVLGDSGSLRQTREGGLVSARVGDVSHSEEVWVGWVRELHGGLDTNIAVCRVDNAVWPAGREGAQSKCQLKGRRA